MLNAQIPSQQERQSRVRLLPFQNLAKRYCDGVSGRSGLGGRIEIDGKSDHLQSKRRLVGKIETARWSWSGRHLPEKRRDLVIILFLRGILVAVSRDVALVLVGFGGDLRSCGQTPTLFVW